MGSEILETRSPLPSPEHSPPTSFHTPSMELVSDPTDLLDIPLQPLDPEDEAPPTSPDPSSSPPLPPNPNYTNHTDGNPWANTPVVLESVEDYLASNRTETLSGNSDEKVRASSETLGEEGGEEGDEEDEEDPSLETGQDGSNNTRGEEDKKERRETDEVPPTRNKRKKRTNAESRETREPGEPILLTTSITTTYAKDLHELCQSHVRLAPIFAFEQNKPQEFTVVLKLVGPLETKEIAVDGIFPSKRHAKEAAAALGIEYVRDLPKDTSSRLFTMEQEPENWVGLLSGIFTSPLWMTTFPSPSPSPSPSPPPFRTAYMHACKIIQMQITETKRNQTCATESRFDPNTPTMLLLAPAIPAKSD